MLLAFVAGFGFSSCVGEKGSVAPTYVMRTFEKRHGDCDTENGACTTVLVMYPEFTSPNQRAATLINGSIENLILTPFSQDRGPRDVTQLIQDFIDDYDELRRDMPGYAQGWTLERKVGILVNSADVLSVGYREVAYTGGAHPNTITRYKNFDVESGREVGLDDLLVPGYSEQLNAIAERHFRRSRSLAAEDDLAAAGFWFEGGRFALNENFAVTMSGLMFQFNPYEVAPYAMGPTEFVVPYADMAPLMPADGLLARLRH